MKSIIKFFEPLSKHPYLILPITALIVSILHTGLAGLVEQNSYDIHMLASEQLNELGPKYAGESELHRYMIKQYTNQLEQRHLATLLRLLYREYSPKKALASVLLGLEGLEEVAENKKEVEAKKAIWQAGLASNQLHILGNKFPWSPTAWFKSKALPDQLLMNLDKALTNSQELVGRLEIDQTLESAVEACRANRKAILLLFLSRSGYENRERIKDFQADIKRAHDFTLRLAEKTGKDTDDQKLLYETAKSEEHRVKILEAMLANDMDKVCELLKEAIERAFDREENTP